MDEQTSEPSLPLDMIFEILLKATIKPLLLCKSVCKDWYTLISGQLFIKSLLRCKSVCNVCKKRYLLRCKSVCNVCKKWYTLISDQHFIKSRYKHHRLIYKTGGKENNLKICPLSDVTFDKSFSNATQLEIPLQRSQPPKISIVGSCNGLLCILVEDDNTLFIYNPTTRRTSDSILPPHEKGIGYYGFGYDETTHDYKVVKISLRDRPLGHSGWGAMIYSLKAGSWKKNIDDCFPCHQPLNDGKFLNGALHWATSDGDILSLDLGKETYGHVSKPPYGKRSESLTLGVFGEWLCVLCNYPESRVGDVWVMKDYGVQRSWTKLPLISHPNDRFSSPSYMQFHALLCVSNYEKLLLQRGANLDVCDCINGSYSEIQNFDGFREAYIIVESLVWPDFGDGKKLSDKVRGQKRKFVDFDDQTDPVSVEKRLAGSKLEHDDTSNATDGILSNEDLQRIKELRKG